MLRNYTLVTGDVDLAKLRDGEGEEAGSGDQSLGEEGGEGRGRRALIGIRSESVFSVNPHSAFSLLLSCFCSSADFVSF